MNSLILIYSYKNSGFKTILSGKVLQYQKLYTNWLNNFVSGPLCVSSNLANQPCPKTGVAGLRYETLGRGNS
ncbi:MAG: hypothetical protein LH628_19390 [Microcoleus sp. CAN_BIN18]|nr:hypothetical protein [Microcoleus sp. CAN_BIN18]